MALGHSNYGKMALQLAVSLKNTCPGVPIALIYTGSAIADIGQRVQLSLYFDEMILAPEYIYTRAGKTEYIKAKTYLYEMSPWDTTIFLDADMIAFPSRSMAELFQELDAHDFSIQNRGFIDLSAEKLSAESYWVDLYELKTAYKLTAGRYYQVHSEFIYFKKTKKNTKFWLDVKNTYDALKVKVKTVFDGAIPDELPISIAMIKNDMHPHQVNYTPIYWQVVEKRHEDLHQLYQEFYAYSTGGSFHSNSMKERYNKLAKWHSNTAGVQQFYYLQDKRKFLINRSNI